MSTIVYKQSSKDAFKTKQWWKEAIVYQIWPHSFCDSNGDGIGDFQGIRSKLDHIQKLGVDVIWLSPCYTSPMLDFGYDISDYQNVNPDYGTLDDWQAMVDDIHARGMKILADGIFNHSAAQHPWFLESRASRENARRDWYFWRPPKYNEKGERMPPNNWAAIWGNQSAWEWDEKTQEYFLRLFTGDQPDLNWDNADVRKEIFRIMRWWMDRGVDGWRLDVISLISKPIGLPDAPIVNPDNYFQPNPCTNGPNCHTYLKEMNREVLAHYDQMNVGEFARLYDPDSVAQFVIPENHELQTLFLFELVNVDGSFGTWAPFKLQDFKRIQTKWQISLPALGGWNSIYLQNHDQARCLSRFGNDSKEYRSVSAKMLAMMEATLSGTLYIYQGECIGMTNMPKEWPLEEYKDVATKQRWEANLKDRREKTGKQDPDMSDVWRDIQHKARDHARTPVQWDDSENAGFSTGKPWMRVNDNYKEINAKQQLGDPESVYQFWQTLLKVRKSNSACTYGYFKDTDPDHADVFAYTKSNADQKLFVVLNFSSKALEYAPFEEAGKVGKVILANLAVEDTNLAKTLKLRPYEGRIYSIEGHVSSKEAVSRCVAA